MALPETLPKQHIDSAFARFMSPAPVAKSTESTEVTAAGTPLQKRITSRLENTKDGICPYCKSRMQLTNAAGFQVFVCGHDRAVAPVPNGFDSTAALLSSL